MSDVAQQAAERIIQATDEYDYVYWDGNGRGDPEEDAVTVARAYLSENARYNAALEEIVEKGFYSAERIARAALNQQELLGTPPAGEGE